MAGAGTIRGVVGEVKWHHYVAAGILKWTITRPNGEWHLRAQIGLDNKFNLAQRPLTFVVPIEAGRWRWPVLSSRIEVENGLRVFIAQLGELEN